MHTQTRSHLLALRSGQIMAMVVITLAIVLALLPYLTMIAPATGDPVDSPATQRAMQTIALLSQSTRSIGDPHHDVARDWLVAELGQMGLEVQTQETPVAGQPAAMANIIGRLAGESAHGNAVLLIAHYDSAPGSPGASDNGSGVAVVLEIARQVAAGPRPVNDLLVLLSDGEEQGVLGVPPFIERHPWAKSVQVALNFDGISTGPVFLWQSGMHNTRLIEWYAATPRPWGVSWIDGIARVLPLDTDFRPFQQAGTAGASFTTPYLPVAYHTALDQPGLVNPLSIRHAIEQGLALAQTLLGSDLREPPASDQVYLTFWGGLFLHYPAVITRGLGVIAGLLTSLILAWSVKTRLARLRAVGSGALFTLINLLFVLLLQLAIEVVVYITNPMLSLWIKIPGSLVLLALLLGYGFRRLEKRIRPVELLLGGQAVWSVCAVWSSLANPLFSPPLTLILLASLLPYGVLWLRFHRPAAPAARLVSLALILLMGAPVVYLLYMISGMIWIPAAIGAAAFALLFALAYPFYRLAAGED